MKNPIILFASVIAIILIAGGVFLSKDSSNSGSNPNNMRVASHAQNTQGLQIAPDFSLEDLNGETITLSDYQGVKPVILDFWATWCPNCQRDMPRLSNYYEKYKDQIEVIGVNLKENKSLVAKFAEDKNIKFPIVLDQRGLTARDYGVRYTNFHVLINKEGEVVRTIPGDINESDIKSLLN